MTAFRATGAFTGSRSLPPREERMGPREPLPAVETPPPPRPVEARHPWRPKLETARAAAARKKEERVAAGIPPTGRTRVAMERPPCPRCQKPAASRGLAPNGQRRRWKCSTCKRQWSTAVER